MSNLAFCLPYKLTFFLIAVFFFKKRNLQTTMFSLLLHNTGFGLVKRQLGAYVTHDTVQRLTFNGGNPLLWDPRAPRWWSCLCCVCKAFAFAWELLGTCPSHRLPSLGCHCAGKLLLAPYFTLQQMSS